MKKPNGYGSIKKLSGNRRRPFVFVVSVDGKQKPIEYFTTQIEAEIYQAEYNKKQQKILHGHQIIFKELFYRWLPSHIDKYQPAKSTISNYKISFIDCTINDVNKPIEHKQPEIIARLIIKSTKISIIYLSFRHMFQLKYTIESFSDVVILQ